MKNKSVQKNQSSPFFPPLPYSFFDEGHGCPSYSFYSFPHSPSLFSLITTVLSKGLLAAELQGVSINLSSAHHSYAERPTGGIKKPKLFCFTSISYVYVLVWTGIELIFFIKIAKKEVSCKTKVNSKQHTGAYMWISFGVIQHWRLKAKLSAGKMRSKMQY